MTLQKMANRMSKLDQGKVDAMISAIADGKYSLACAIFLSSTGYNPGLYMPYRTYHRLRQAHEQVAKKVS